MAGERKDAKRGVCSEDTHRRQDCAKARLTLISLIVSCAIMLPLKRRLVLPSYVCLFTPLLKSQTEKVEGRLLAVPDVYIYACLFLSLVVTGIEWRAY